MSTEAQPGRKALAHIDETLAKRPHKEDLLLSQATREICDLRDRMIERRREGAFQAHEHERLARLNGVLSVVLATHFPMADTPWDELVQARVWMADIVAEVEAEAQPA